MKVNFNGQMVEALRLRVNTESENWNKYELSDGTHMRLRITLTNAFRSTGKFNDNGDPVYHAEFAIAMTPDFVPELLRQEPKTLEVVQGGKAN